ncbi:GNAT family N-acetyltransferase [Couchioplanes caeruleus]|uniref:GNAT family N-acetyltransferase n=2 Tax=Couchioplanes caeruleus TaxID=56438 RepID=A0A1K0FY69_9ACTN|nr:GNAT family N-acetyltransferase [Couchioplanes caeruleus]OJF10018.1 GNAT family N-acetyltransferase [Couchioplanes caeruleus subsp. caeruleus]ROP31643.1 ribosomal protein S18 acetylase RimI-like enzyme [Couchioplanes caeruleus]
MTSTLAPALTVHRVTPGDAARMRALRLEMLADSPLAFLETLAQAAARPHADYRRRIVQASSGVQLAQFVADPAPRRGGSTRPGDRLIGHAGGTVLPEDPAATVVFAVYVTPTHRGRGVLASLVEAVAEWSLSAGRRELMLEVVIGNDRAVRAYERLGFEDTGVRVPHPVVPGLRELQMRRRA